MRLVNQLLILLAVSGVTCSSSPTIFSITRIKRGQGGDNLLDKLTILVVEDEAIIRMGTVHMLQDAGYAVLEAHNAETAIQILEARNDIRAVFTDIKMPGTLCGLRLARAIRDRWPPIHLIVASGLSAPTEKEFTGIGRFIPKPYAAEHVLGALAELLGPNPAPYRYFKNVVQNYGRVA
jgi:CheY-like chemotaxis protein